MGCIIVSHRTYIPYKGIPCMVAQETTFMKLAMQKYSRTCLLQSSLNGAKISECFRQVAIYNYFNEVEYHMYITTVSDKNLRLG